MKKDQKRIWEGKPCGIRLLDDEKDNRCMSSEADDLLILSQNLNCSKKYLIF